MSVLVSTYPIGPFYISPISPLYDVPHHHPHHFPHLGLTMTNPHPVAPLGSISAGFPSWVQHWGNHVLIIFLGNHLNRKAMECPKSRASDHFLGMSTKKKCMYINIPVGEQCGTYRFFQKKTGMNIHEHTNYLGVNTRGAGPWLSSAFLARVGYDKTGTTCWWRPTTLFRVLLYHHFNWLYPAIYLI